MFANINKDPPNKLRLRSSRYLIIQEDYVSGDSIFSSRSRRIVSKRHVIAIFATLTVAAAAALVVPQADLETGSSEPQFAVITEPRLFDPTAPLIGRKEIDPSQFAAANVEREADDNVSEVLESKTAQNLDNFDDDLADTSIDDDAEKELDIQIAKLAQEESPTSPVNNHWVDETVDKGDTLSSVFLDLNIPYATMQAIANHDKSLKLTNLKPGQKLSFLLDSDNRLLTFIQQISDKEQIRFSRTDTSRLDFNVLREPANSRPDEALLAATSNPPVSTPAKKEATKPAAPAETKLAQKPASTAKPAAPAKKPDPTPAYQKRGRLVVVNFKKGQTFSSAANAAGLTYTEINLITRLFKGRIQFTRHIQAGDSLRVLFSDSKGKGRINAVEFKLAKLGKVATYRNSADGKYYDERGLTSTGTSFRRFPINGKVVISSGFNPSRRHPVTHKVRPHNGTDFAVRVGTPVLSTADGVVTKATYSRSAGYYIVIQHRGGYSSVYMHLSKLSVKQGQRVKIGQTIARSGNTGISTGPHLHYELRINNRPVNAMRVSLPKNAENTAGKKFAANVATYKKELYKDSLIAKR